MEPSRIYLDHAASTPLLDAARQAMAPWIGEVGNPSSTYTEGRRAKQAIDEAREIIACALGCGFADVAFTSGGTEAVVTGLLGTALLPSSPQDRVIVSAAEHECVLSQRPNLVRLGMRVETVPVDRYARVDPAAFGALVDEHVRLAVVMHANNELGTLNPVAAMRGAPLLVDAVQSFLATAEPWTVEDLGADLVAVASHKVGGPTGAGALYVRPGTPLAPVLRGIQERERRGGTEHVAAIVGFGAAVAELRMGLEAPARRRAARDAFLAALPGDIAWQRTVPPDVPALGGHAHVRFSGVVAETLLIRLDRAGVAASSGAACSSGSTEPSHVLLACGWREREAREALRFTFGRTTSIEEAHAAAGLVAEAVRALVRSG